MPGQGTSAGQYLPRALQNPALGQGLVGFGQQLAQAGAPSPYKQSFAGGLAQGAGGFAQGLEQYKAQQVQDELFRMKQEEAALQKQKLGLETEKAKRDESEAAAYAAGANSLPPPPGVDPAVWANTPAKEKFQLWTGGVTEANKAPFTGAVKDASGNWVYDPDYITGQEQIKRAGRPLTTIAMPPQETEFSKEYGKTAAQQASAITPAANKARGALDEYAALEKALSDMQAAGGDPGRLAPLFGELSAQAQAYGIDPSSLGLPANAGPYEQALAITNKLALANIGGEGGLPANNFTEADRKYITQIAPQLSNTTEGIAAKIDMGRRVQQRNVVAEELWNSGRYEQTQAGFRQYQKDWAAFVKANPLYTPEERAQLGALSQQPTAGSPKVGDVQEGFMFKGGNPADQNSWVRVP